MEIAEEKLQRMHQRWDKYQGSKVSKLRLLTQVSELMSIQPLVDQVLQTKV
jgi:hypothetical protein